MARFHVNLLIALVCFTYLFRTAGCTFFDFRPKPTGINTLPIDASRDPVQETLDLAAAQTIEKIIDNHKLTLVPIARYSIAGRVVSKKRYYLDWTYKLSPLDLAIAWGKLATHEFDRSIAYDHGNRFYHFRYKSDLPLEQGYIISHSSNNHLIPANPLIDAVLKSVRTDELVQLNGYLLNVKGTDGFEWNSSTKRDDTGGGACELIYVTQVRIGNFKWE